jgi:hypothetical protein
MPSSAPIAGKTAFPDRRLFVRSRPITSGWPKFTGQSDMFWPPEPTARHDHSLFVRCCLLPSSAGSFQAISAAITRQPEINSARQAVAISGKCLLPEQLPNDAIRNSYRKAEPSTLPVAKPDPAHHRNSNNFFSLRFNTLSQNLPRPRTPAY